MCNPPEKESSLAPVAKAAAFLRLLLRPAVARRLGTLVTEGYLAETGWVRSVLATGVLDAAGAPQPWTTLPFIDFIRPRLRQEWTVFEYGAGASTLFYARRVSRVFAVEHDEAFARALQPRLPANAAVLVRAVGSDAYVRAALECVPPPALVVVDGRDRLRCIEAVVPALATDAVLVLDDAERADYAPATSRLRAAGFRAVEFWGLPPGGVRNKCTTVFYRANNVLGL